jgi:O-antigen ligase
MASIGLIWLLDKNRIARWKFSYHYPLTKPIFILVAMNLISTLFADAQWDHFISTLNHSSRLLFIPILAYYLQGSTNPTKKWVLWAFVTAMIFTIICTCLKVYGHIPIGQRTYGNDVFKNHIVTSYFTAVAILMLSIWLTEYKQYKLPIILLMAFCFFYLIFLNTGRIGYVILYINLTVLAWHKYRYKGMTAIYLLLSIVMLLGYCFSDLLAMRVNEFYNDFNSYLHGATMYSDENSIGSRLEFAVNSLKLFAEHPIFGWGNGSFLHAYEETFSGSFTVMTDNPHNQYLKTGVEQGVIGLLALVWLFFCQWRMTRQLKGNDLLLAQGFLLSFFIGCLFNSWLKNYTEFYFYCLMSAYLLPACLPQRQEQARENVLVYSSVTL